MLNFPQSSCRHSESGIYRVCSVILTALDDTKRKRFADKFQYFITRYKVKIKKVHD